MQIDSHVHFWRYGPQTHGWISDAMVALKRDFLPTDLKPLLDAQGIDGCLAVQAEQNTHETRWLLSLAEAHPWIAGVVGWVDLRADGVALEIESLCRNPRLRGLRHIVQDEPDDRFLLKSDFLRGISVLERYGIVYDILVYSRQLAAAVEFASHFPRQRFVVDHMAKPAIARSERSSWETPLRSLGAMPNVYCKVSGLVTEADWRNWRPQDFEYYLDTVLSVFGPDRILFGSDWPVCTLAGSYGQVVSLIKSFVERRCPDSHAKVFGENARNCYDLS